MSISKFLLRNLASVNRKKNKKQTLNAILNASQEHNGMVNIHRIDQNNIGDFYCAPHLYFDQLKGKSLDIFDYKNSNEAVRNNFIHTVSKNALIIGGGGLLNRDSFTQQMATFEKLAKNGKKTVLWGVGHNDKRESSFRKKVDYNIDTSAFGLVGVRDYTSSETFVPCVSCLHPIFDKNYINTQEIGLIFHKKTMKDKSLLKKLSTYPYTSNTKNLNDMITFIGKSETVVTDSYHAMYWAMLLDKKVIAVPNSSKFFDFKYQPAFSTFQDFESQLNKTQVYPGVLDECRDLNLKFAERVFDYLNL